MSSWTSDANNWAQQWSSWDGFVDFFSGVVKDTLPAGDNAGAVQADVRDGQIRVTVDSAEAFPDGAAATATVAGPDGQSIEVELERTDDGHFEGAAEAPRSGTYAVSGIVTDNDGETVLSSSTLASNSYPAEYVPGAPDVAFMTRLANSTDGRTDVTTDNVWDSRRSALPVRVSSSCCRSCCSSRACCGRSQSCCPGSRSAGQRRPALVKACRTSGAGSASSSRRSAARTPRSARCVAPRRRRWPNARRRGGRP